MKRYTKRMLKILLVAIVALILIELIWLLVLKTQVGRYATYWQERADETTQQNELIYVALGDSTAQGIGATSPENGYVGLIAEALEAKTKQNIHVINLSKSGATVADVLREQLPQLEQYRPDVITVGIGANDVSDFNETEFRTDMEALIKALPEHAVISDVPYFGGGIKRGSEKNAVTANKIIHNQAAEYGLALAPLHEVTKTNDSPSRYAPDLFHPSNHGYKNWFNSFWQVLSERTY